MDERPRDRLTKRQRTLLTNARGAIRKAPDSYDQLSYGGESVTCGTPGCVAAQIVAHDPKLQELKEEIRKMPEAWTELGTGGDDRKNGGRNRGRALKVEGTPKLFSAKWPREWRASNEDPARQPGRTFVPTAHDAARCSALSSVSRSSLYGSLRSAPQSGTSPRATIS